MANGDGIEKILGVRVQTLTQLVSSVGVPTLFLCALVYLVGWKLGPPIVEGHVQFLRSTTETQEKIADSLEGTDMMLREFTAAVREEHGMQTKIMSGVDGKMDAACEKLNDIEKAVNQ